MTVDTVDIQYFMPDTDIVETIPEGGDGELSIHSAGRSRMFSDIIIYMYNNTKRLVTSERFFIRTNYVHKFTPYNIT